MNRLFLSVVPMDDGRLMPWNFANTREILELAGPKDSMVIEVLSQDGLGDYMGQTITDCAMATLEFAGLAHWPN